MYNGLTWAKINSPDKLQSINLSFENQVINVLDETCSKSETVSPLRAHFTKYVLIIYRYSGARGGVVVKALRYKPVGRGFDSPWCHRNFSVT